MAATLMYGKPLAERIRAEVAEEVRRLGGVGLATVLVGDDPASQVYIRHKHDAAVAAGFDTRDIRLPADAPEEDVVAQVEALVADDAIDALLVQLPLPDHVDEERVLAAVEPIKDVDGFHPYNAGRLYLGRPTLVPATPLGVMALLEEHGVQLVGAHAVVVGRSEIVGKPVAHLLLRAHATVTICHSRTVDLARHTDVLVVAVGRQGLVTADMIKPGAAVVDVGINRTESGLVGDVDPAAVDVAGFFTPVPGGVGPMTIALLLENALRCAEYRRERGVFPAR